MAGVDELFPRAVTAQKNGDLATAEREYRQILAIDPQHPGSLSNLGVILGQRGALKEAIISSEAATRADPNLAVAHFNLGNLYRRVGRINDAVKCYESVIQITPFFAPAHLNLGISVSETGDWPAALDHFLRAMEVQPNIPDGLHHLGEALTQVGRTDEAIDRLRESLNLMPNLPRSYLALARAYFAANKYDEAIPLLQRALQIQPDHAVIQNFLGIVLDRIGKYDDAQPHFREALRIRPDFVGAWNNLGLSLSLQGRSPEAAAAFAKSLELRPDAAIASHRLVELLSSSSVGNEQLRQEHLNWAIQFAPPAARDQAVSRPQPGSRVKIGYVIGQFQNSVAPTFLETLLARHDRSKFHITCFHNTSQPGESVDRLRKSADDWYSLAVLDLAAATERIRTCQIDVLVDLNGHTPGNRLPLFAQRPASLQISLFGYPISTGLAAIDFRISDGLIDPPGAGDSLGPEKVLRLPDMARLYVPLATAPLPSPLPSATQQTFTFGCLSAPGKLSDLCIETWAQLLKEVPNSRLMLQSGGTIETARFLNGRFAQCGIDLNRLMLVFRMTEADYLKAYQLIDIALDPFPFNGRATTCDALWMGVPVLTVAGQDSRSRQGVSILTTIGLSDFIADTPDKLIKLASIWSEQRETLADFRTGLREMMTQSPLTNAEGYVRNLEAAYTSAMASR